jgi:sugar phosphate isomerase/epimerase
MREVLDAVDSPWVTCDVDPVNWMTLDTVYNSGDALRHMVAVLRGRVTGGHAKDVVIEDRLVTHISQCPPGRGLLDYRVFMSLLEGISPDLPLVTEGCEEADLPHASAFLHGIARELGIRIRDDVNE